MFGIMLQLPHPHALATLTLMAYDGPDAVRCLALVHSRRKVCEALRSGISAVGLDGYQVCATAE
eukprot:COSAG02_NODE_4080_length_5818_cov_17.059101_3_plen_64_part_00